MIRSMTLGAVMALAALSAPVAWAQDAALCKGIADVMRHQATGFREIRGEAKGTRFTSKLWLPGAVDCWLSAYRDGKPIYNCSWPWSDPVTIELELRRYADQAAACFPGAKADYNKDGGELVGEFDVRGINVLWVIDRTYKRIGLAID